MSTSPRSAADAGGAPGAAGLPDLSRDPTLNRLMITLSIMLATIIQTLDGTIANVALPHMQGSLSASQDQITWVLTSYIVASAIATPMTGWLCDRFGQKTVFLVAVAGFTVASACCGLATSLAQIVAARLLQGVFGAAFVPLSQTVLLEINPPESQGPAMAMWGMGVMVGPILGPTLGGWLTDNYDWRWVFFINIPLGALAFYGIVKYLRPVAPQRRLAFDMFGFTTLSLTIGSLQMLLDRGEQNDWFGSLETWVEAVVLAVSLTYFVIHTAMSPPGRSFFDYRLLKNRNFVSGLVFIFTTGMVMYAGRALMPNLLQSLLGYPVWTAGLVTAPTSVGTMVAMIIVGRLVGRIDIRLLLFTGFSLTALSLWQMCAYSTQITTADIVWPGVLQGVGMGLVFVPLSAATFSTLAPAMRAQGTSIFSLVRNMGSSVGIAMVQTLLVRNTQINHASLAEHITPANPALQDPALAGLYNPASPAGLALLNNEVTTQAAMIAYVNDFRLLLLMTLLVLPFVLLVKPPSARTVTGGSHAAVE